MSSLLSSLYNTNRSPNQRSSSMFTKHFSFTTTNNYTRQQKARPASVSKPIKHDFGQNNLVKWTPLIKTVHKLGAKLKKQYFFFWCRMQAMIKTKQSKTGTKDQAITQINDLKNLQQQVYKQNNQTSNQEKAQNVLSMNNNNNFNRKNLQESNATQTTIEQSMVVSKSKDTILYQFVGSLQAIQYKISQNYLKVLGFNLIRKKSNKIKAMSKFINMNFVQHNTKVRIEVLRKIKSRSTNAMKLQILLKLLQNFINKQLNDGFKIIQKQSQSKYKIKMQELQKPKKFESLLIIQQAIIDKVISIPKKQVKEQGKTQPIQIPKVSQVKNQIQLKQKPIITLDKTSTIQKPSLQITKFIPKISQNLPLKITKNNRIPFVPSIIQQDKTITLDLYTKIVQKQKMKKLSHLYNQEPIFEIPDISDITLFNSTINISNQIILNKQILVENEIQQEQSKQQQEKIFNSKQQIEDFWGRPIFSSELPSNNYCQQMRYDSIQQNSSPKFERYQLNTPSAKSRKSSSCANITLIRKPSSNNGNKTPSSSKKCFQILSKKNSLSNLYKATSRQYQTISSTCKSPILKSWNYNGSCEIHTQKQDKALINSDKNTSNNMKKSTEKYSIDIRIPLSTDFKKQKTNLKQNEKIIFIEQKSSNKKISGTKVLGNSSGSGSKKYIKTSWQSDDKKNIKMKQKINTKFTNKQNILNQSSSKKLVKLKDSKSNFCSQFNAIDPVSVKLKGIDNQNNPSYKNFTQRQTIKRNILQQLDQNLPIFQQIQMTQQNYQLSSQLKFDSGKYSQSAQLMEQQSLKSSVQQKSKKLRSKLDKVQLNTARKMKIQIQNMINQRKKSSLGLLKF